MATKKSDATSVTKLNNVALATQVPVIPKRKVTYVFHATSSKNLSIPYAVAVNGKIQAAFSTKPKRVGGDGGKIITFVDQGESVCLYLNSDAHPSHRKNAVYAVAAAERDVLVTVTEKPGKHADSDAPIRKVAKDAKLEAEKKEDEYTAPLTGDIWMKVSHKYTAAEVAALVPEGTSSAVLKAVTSIYEGLASAKLAITEPSSTTQAPVTVAVTFSDSDNPKDNITHYSLLAEGLTRVHPGGYAALFSSAIESKVDSLTLTSCWRPMLGSIAHRAGLGLDVGYVGSTKMNRQELRIGKGTHKENDTANVSDEESKRFREYEDAIVGARMAEREQTATNRALDVLEVKRNPAASSDELANAEKRSEAAKDKVKSTKEAETNAARAWNKERDANEPASVKLYRTSLLKCSCVQQLFDPWFMDRDTHDKLLPEPNMQRGASTSNERLHSHHLHVTVYEPKIL